MLQCPLSSLLSNPTEPSFGRCPAFVDRVTAPVGSTRWRPARTGKIGHDHAAGDRRVREMTWTLEARELVVVREGRRILDRASILVRAGEAVAIQGPSGSGQTTSA